MVGRRCFRPLYTGLVSNKIVSVTFSTKTLLFPSPIYGASFKLYYPEITKINHKSFRPLYTGLVSNSVEFTIEDQDLGFRPLYTGLVSNSYIFLFQ